MRDGTSPGAPISRDEWILQARASASANRTIDQMAVHDLGAYAIVSFREVDTGAKATSKRFVVDCWKRDGDTWKLAIRYASDVPAASQERTPAGTLDKRY
jgi:hypothetical protein